MESLDEYLENTNQVVSDSLATIQSNTDVVYQTLKDMGKEYGLSITESLTSPWQEGEYAIQSFSEKFGISMSATVEELEALELQFKETMLEIEQAGIKAVNTVKESANSYQSAEYQEPKQEELPKQDTPNPPQNETTSKEPPKKGDTVTIKKTATHFGSNSSNKKMASWLPGKKRKVYAIETKNGTTQVRVGDFKGGITGWVNLKDLEGYAKGTTGVKKDQLALIDELGEELIMHAGQNGKLEYLTKGSSVIPADLTANLVDWSAINPQDMLDRNRPSIGVAPSIVNNNVEFKVDASIGTLLKIDEFNGDDPDEVLKMINKALDQHTKNLNSALRRYTR